MALLGIKAAFLSYQNSTNARTSQINYTLVVFITKCLVDGSVSVVFYLHKYSIENNSARSYFTNKYYKRPIDGPRGIGKFNFPLKFQL